MFYNVLLADFLLNFYGCFLSMKRFSQQFMVNNYDNT